MTCWSHNCIVPYREEISLFKDGNCHVAVYQGTCSQTTISACKFLLGVRVSVATSRSPGEQPVVQTLLTRVG